MTYGFVNLVYSIQQCPWEERKLEDCFFALVCIIPSELKVLYEDYLLVEAVLSRVGYYRFWLF